MSTRPIDVPENIESSVLGLIKDRRLVRIGDTAEKALEAFEKPDKARVLTEVPAGWPKDIRATGWETDDRGLGILLASEKIVGIMYSEYQTSPERIEQIRGDYMSTFGPPQAVSDTQNVHYSFWEDGENRLAICSAKNSQGEHVVTVCCGPKSIMERLGLSMREAKSESEKAERILAENRAKIQ